MTERSREIHLASEEATCRAARALAPRLRPGDTILLGGEIGAGKTHFARCLIQACLPAPEDVPSPTYTLVQTYPGADGAEIWHADLYRIGGPAEIEETGLTAAFEDAICLVEWPDRLHDLAPASALRLTLLPADDPGARRMVMAWTAPRWDAVIGKALPDG